METDGILREKSKLIQEEEYIIVSSSGLQLYSLKNRTDAMKEAYK
jgi:hypothetical protein